MSEETKKDTTESRLEFIRKVADIQARMHVGKDVKNEYGGFKYKKNEQIISAVKPMLKEHGLIYNQSVEMVLIGDRYYAKATSILTDGVNQLTNTAYAREPERKKGMDESQVTGTASTYAKKQGSDDMFLAGAESVDPDDLNGNETPEVPKTEKPTAPKQDDRTAQAQAKTNTTTKKSPEELMDVVIKRINHERKVALDKKEIKDTQIAGYNIERFKYHKGKIEKKYGDSFMNETHWQSILTGIGAELKGGEK